MSNQSTRTTPAPAPAITDEQIYQLFKAALAEGDQDRAMLCEIAIGQTDFGAFAVEMTQAEARAACAIIVGVTPFAICYTKPGTTLTFWLNRFHSGGFIWSLVRTAQDDAGDRRWNQPPLRFESEAAAAEFIVSELAGNPLARVARVGD